MFRNPTPIKLLTHQLLFRPLAYCLMNVIIVASNRICDRFNFKLRNQDVSIFKRHECQLINHKTASS